MLQKYQSYPNGMTNNTNGVFEYLGVHLSVMNESLLQSYNDKIRVFPALPKDAAFVGRFTLLAKGGFLVSVGEGGRRDQICRHQEPVRQSRHAREPVGHPASASAQARRTTAI